ncbi:hypothetical protein ACIP88_26515 [Streptomyces uncialis]|uniref:hypothetical protein n=1 Tax=Streptomyces uncialis TaxID=1048205 RepID=UPI003805687E
MCPIYEDGLPGLLGTHTATGRLRFTTSLTEAAEFADVHFLAVGTPLDADRRSYDTGQVFGAARALAPRPVSPDRDHRQVHRHRRHLTRPRRTRWMSGLATTVRSVGADVRHARPHGPNLSVVR